MNKTIFTLFKFLQVCAWLVGLAFCLGFFRSIAFCYIKIYIHFNKLFMEYYPRKIEQEMERWLKRKEIILLKGPYQGSYCSSFNFKTTIINCLYSAKAF
jgi:hypothetical protein